MSRATGCCLQLEGTEVVVGVGGVVVTKVDELENDILRRKWLGEGDSNTFTFDVGLEGGVEWVTKVGSKRIGLDGGVELVARELQGSLFSCQFIPFSEGLGGGLE